MNDPLTTPADSMSSKQATAYLAEQISSDAAMLYDLLGGLGDELSDPGTNLPAALTAANQLVARIGTVADAIAAANGLGGLSAAEWMLPGARHQAALAAIRPAQAE